MNKKFYITTTLPYVNADPHIGFAMEIIQADVIARAKRAQGFEVFFNTGADEHGVKILRKAQEVGMDPKVYCDMYAAKFDNLKSALNLTYDNFIRTTDEHHIKAAQEFWIRCQKNGDIYKKNYSVKYCVGCELEKTDSELENGKCPVHPNQEIELIEEENYFFKYSNYKKPLLDFYEKYGVDVIRYYLLLEITPTEDGDFTIEKLEQRYNSDLASGIGNLLARTITLAVKPNFEEKKPSAKIKKEATKTKKICEQYLENFKFNDSLKSIWELITFCDK